MCGSATAQEPGILRAHVQAVACSCRKHTAQLLHGYRFAKRQGKSNSNNALKPASNKHFCNFGPDRAESAFTFDSLRSLNRPSNLVRHDPIARRQNGERSQKLSLIARGNNGTFQRVGRDLAFGNAR